MIIKGLEGGISESVWKQLVKDHPNIIPFHEVQITKEEIFSAAYLSVSESIVGRLLWDWEHNCIDVELNGPIRCQVGHVLLGIADDLNGILYLKKGLKFDPALHLPPVTVKLDRSTHYFDSGLWRDSRWLAIRTNDRQELIRALKLKLLSEGPIRDIDENHLWVSPSFENWTLLIGDGLPYIFLKDGEASSEEALSNMITSLKRLSKKLIEVQYFEHSEKSSVTGYIKCRMGKRVFAHWRSELDDFTQGKAPKEIKSIHPATAHDVAAIWSMDVLDLGYIKEMHEGSWIEVS